MDAGSRRTRVTEEAAEWWVILQGDASRAQREQYVDWLRESPLHVAELLRIAQVHGALAQFERWNNLPTHDDGKTCAQVVPLPARAEPRDEPFRPARPYASRLKVIAATATLVLAAIAGGFWLYLERGQVIQTERGEVREVALADGSVVRVDPESLLRVNYGPQLRRVYLERGRALFHVAKDPQRPFFVRADDTTVRAVGTEFGVEQGRDKVVITVAEGKVAVFPLDQNAEQPRLIHDPLASGRTTKFRGGAGTSTEQAPQTTAPHVASAAPDEIFLTANEQLTVSVSGSAEPVREVDSHRALAWAEGRLILESESVAYAVREFNRYNRIQLKITDQALAQRTISGVFNAEDPQSFVAFIQSVAPVRVTRDAEANITIATR